MSINNLLKQYKEAFDMKKVIKMFPKRYKAILFLLFPVLLVILIILVIFEHINRILFFLGIVLFTFLFILLFNKFSTKVLRSKFSNHNMAEYNGNARKIFINKTGIDKMSSNKLKELIEFITRYSKEYKTQHSIKINIIPSIVISIISAYIGYLSSQDIENILTIDFTLIFLQPNYLKYHFL